ncbi:MAG: type II secretion system minor pseudopilin GspH [Gammaproteobacteria bacterium]|nr:type II secretion system minor pseudopilin GspH [Gammaproteobacteria bacterium]MCP5425801.1 type II secretion system minor pseudopilin GspH [Gammaproteobacteria bacterium]MCP5458588.1 type II secretion system minor pseudopilin GspH [Gammaproteobacteria bacterium]
MPTSVPGISTNSGFTLLEIMVTVVLIGIIASFAVLAVRGDDPNERLAREAYRLYARLELEQQEAMLRGEQRGVLFTTTGYSFMVRNGRDEWGVLSDSSLPQSYSLPRGMEMALNVDDRPVVLADSVGRQPQPQVLVLASGELTPFLVTLGVSAEPGDRYALAGDLVGHLQLDQLAP